MVQQNLVKFLVTAVLLLSCAAARAQEPKAHRMGEWPALSANILNAQQKNLNLDDRDFVIEVWFKPLDWSKYKTTAPACLVSKKGGADLAGYDLCYYQDETVSLTLCDKANELLPESEFHASKVLKMDGWNYLAVVAGHKDKKVTFYVDGKKVKECGGFNAGDISNRDNFNITYNEYMPNSQAHCLLSQARVWKLTKDMPAEMDKVVAAHQTDAAKVSDALKGAADYSMWTFEAGNDNIKDQGSNGNELVYTPWAFKGQQDTVKVPQKVAGDTYYVDAAKGDDANPGSKDKPFKTLARGARAAMPGDLLHICAGVYRESLRLREGTSDKPITAEGEPGTVISGFDPVSGWVKGDGGQWVIKDWTGNYSGPMDAKEDDARKEPGNILFVGGTPMDFVMTRTELAPGTWTIAPILHSEGAKTITLCPLPGVDPTKVATELSDCRKSALLMTTKFNQVRGIHFTGGGVGAGGVCNLLENCVVDWGGGNGIGYGGRDNIIRNNKIYWFGLTGFGGGGGIRNTFEGNTISYCCWRLFSGSWHGGAIKIIPTVLDFRMRNNEICYNWVAGIWYDTNAQGCVTEGNVVHDNTGSALFDEFCFANTWQDNIAYNNVGPGMCVGNSNEDIVQRNILFNNTGGIYHRTDHIGAKNPPDVRKQQEDEWLPKFDVRRYNGLISYEREKRFRDMSDLYCYDYVGDNNMRNQILENVIIEHSSCIGQAIHYGVPGRVIPKDAENTFDRNYYWTDQPGQKIIVNGPLVDLKTWQELSGQDKDSRFIDPWKNRDQMPEWFKKKFNFKKDEFRPTQATWDKYMATKTRRSISQLVMFSRLLRSKTIEEAKFSDPDISGLYFECEGKRCLALWSANPSVKYFTFPEGSEVVRENKFLQRKPLEILGGKASVYLTEYPITLLGVDKGLAEDNSLALQPQSKEGDKAVEFRLTLTNTGAGEQAYDLAASVGAGWDVSPAKVQKTVAAGQKEDVTLKLTPPAEVSEGVFQLAVAGKVGGADMAASKVFKVGLARQIPFRTEHITVDGDMAKWAKFEPSATADKADRVVFGRDQWKGPQDLSAKVWLRWENDQGRDLFFAADVTDDKIVTNHRDDDPTKSDSVELLVDARAAWKQYMKEYTAGVFKVVLVPADGDKPVTAKFIGPAFGYIVKAASKKTDHGYSVELQIHFRSNLVETPGWVEGKEVRVGVLVNDSDDPAGKDKKCVLGLWHTAADAETDCSSLTTMTLKK